MEQEIKAKSKRKPKTIDRAIITPEAKLKLDVLKKQITDTYGEFIKLNYTDLVTLVVQMHGDNLSEDELCYVSGRWYDEGKFIKWCYKVYCEAIDRGEKITLEEITAKYRPASANRASKKIRRPRKSKLETISALDTSPNIESFASGIPPKI